MPILATLLMLACNQGNDEQFGPSMTLYDDDLKTELVERLKQGNVLFKLDRNTIWYSISDQEIVGNLFDELLLERGREFTFYERHYAEIFVDALRTSNIVASITPRGDNQFIVAVPPEHQVEASRLMSDVVFPNAEFRESE